MSVKVITEQVLGSSDIYCHLSIPADPLSAPKSSSVTLFVSNCAQAQGCPMGSLVYSIPTGKKENPVVSTSLFTQDSTIEFASRLSLILAQKCGRPVFVGASVYGDSLNNAVSTVSIVNFVKSNLS